MLAKKLSMTLKLDGVPRYFIKKVPRYRYSVPSTDDTGTNTEKVPRYFSARYFQPLRVSLLGITFYMVSEQKIFVMVLGLYGHPGILTMHEESTLKK